MDEIIKQGVTLLFQYGLSGLLNVGLIWLVYKQREELKDTRDANRVEVAEKDKLIFQSQESRVAEARAGYEVISSITKTQDAIIGAIRKG